MYAADHRGEMRHKRQADRIAGGARQALLDLRQMPMPGHAVGLEIVGGFRKQECHFRLSSAAGYAGFCIGDQTILLDHASFQQRDESQLHRSRITAWIGDQPGGFDLRAIDLRQTVYRLGNQIGTGVAHAIPFLPSRNVLQTKICREIDHFDARLQQGSRLLHGNAIRGGEEHQIAFFQARLFGMGERQIHIAAQTGKHLADQRTGIGTRSDHLQRNLRMCRQQAQQFDSGVARSPDYANFDHLHFQKIMLCILQ